MLLEGAFRWNTRSHQPVHMIVCQSRLCESSKISPCLFLHFLCIASRCVISHPSEPFCDHSLSVLYFTSSTATRYFTQPSMPALKQLSAQAVHPNADPLFNPYPSRRSVVHSTGGMVASTQPLASEAGQRILKQGGNAAVRAYKCPSPCKH